MGELGGQGDAPAGTGATGADGANAPAGTGARNRSSRTDTGLAARWRNRLGALKEPNFRRFFVGQTTSTLGSQMSPLAVTFAVLQHGTATDVGYVLAAGVAPLVVFLLVGGVIADRLGRRAVMLGADVLRTVAQAALAGWVIAGGVPLWGFIVLVVLQGIGSGLFQPALTGLVPEIVSDARLTEANALRGLSYSTAGIIGPALAGIIVATTSPGWAIAADAASYVVSVLTLAGLRLAPRAQREATSFVHDLRTGWREFWRRTWLWVVVVQFSLCNVAIFAPLMILGPAIAKARLGGASVWGAILACQGAGAILGGLVMLRYRPRRPLLLATASAYTWVVPLLGLALGFPVPVIAAGAALGGISFAMFGALWDTTMQRNVPGDVLSRVSAYDWLGSLVLLPIGDALTGPVAHALGTRHTILGAAVFVAAAITAVLCVPSVTGLLATARAEGAVGLVSRPAPGED